MTTTTTNEKETHMCANNMTYAAATGCTTDRARDATKRYQALMRATARASLYGTDDEARDAAERARKFAHAESYRGNLGPLLDQLERNLGGIR